MKKNILLIFALLLPFFYASAYDFSAICPSGQTLYYTITSDVAPYTVEVSRQNADWPYYYSSPSGDITIPDTVTFDSITYTVTSLGYDLFFNCNNITSVSIPNTVTSIGEGAFAGCTSLSHVNIPSSVTSLNGRVFLACSSLDSISLPSTLTSIGDRAFANCSSLTSIIIPSTVTYIGPQAFYGCIGLTSFTLPNSVVSMGDRAFNGCNNIAEPIYNNTIFAFYPAAYDSVYSIPEGIKTIVGWTFDANTLITRITFPASLTSIGYRAFSLCPNLRIVDIPDSVTTIGESAFDGCGNIRSITLGKSVTTLGGDAFWGCTSVGSIVSRCVVAPNLENTTVFDRIPISIPVSIPCGSTASYMSRWSHFSNFEEPVMPVVAAVSANTAQGTATVVSQPGCADSLSVVQAFGIGAYSFLQWQDGNQDNPRTILVDRDTTLTAYFVHNHTLLATSSNVNLGTTMGSGEYAHGGTATMAAIAKAGCRFMGWQDGELDNPRNVTMLSDTAFTALFGLPDTMLVHDTTIVQNYDTVFLPQYIYDTIIQTFTDTMIVELFDTVILHDSVFVHDTTFIQNFDTIFLPQYIHDTIIQRITDTAFVERYDTIFLHDTVIVEIQPEYFTIAVYGDGHGTGIGNGNFPKDCHIEIAGMPDEGYRFARWSDGNESNPRPVEVTTNASFTAIFEPIGTEGIVNVENIDYTLDIEGDIVTLSQVAGKPVRIFDSVGRCLLSEKNGGEVRHYKMPCSGVYLIQVGGHNAQRFVITH